MRLPAGKEPRRVQSMECPTKRKRARMEIFVKMPITGEGRYAQAR